MLTFPAELDGVMQKGGLDPPMDIVYSILESIDMDTSGDIEPSASKWAERVPVTVE